jgi:hypothetical protein
MELDNGHNKQGEIFIIDDGYKTMYQCVCDVLARLAVNGFIVNVENIISVIVKREILAKHFLAILKVFCVK